MIELKLWTGADWFSVGIYLRDLGMQELDRMVRNGYIVTYQAV